jgi:hypothetical protein
MEQLPFVDSPSWQVLQGVTERQTTMAAYRVGRNRRMFAWLLIFSGIMLLPGSPKPPPSSESVNAPVSGEVDRSIAELSARLNALSERLDQQTHALRDNTLDHRTSDDPLQRLTEQGNTLIAQTMVIAAQRGKLAEHGLKLD